MGRSPGCGICHERHGVVRAVRSGAELDAQTALVAVGREHDAGHRMVGDRLTGDGGEPRRERGRERRRRVEVHRELVEVLHTCDLPVGVEARPVGSVDERERIELDGVAVHADATGDADLGELEGGIVDRDVRAVDRDAIDRQAPTRGKERVAGRFRLGWLGRGLRLGQEPTVAVVDEADLGRREREARHRDLLVEERPRRDADRDRRDGQDGLIVRGRDHDVGGFDAAERDVEIADRDRTRSEARVGGGDCLLLQHALRLLRVEPDGDADDSDEHERHEPEEDPPRPSQHGAHQNASPSARWNHTGGSFRNISIRSVRAAMSKRSAPTGVW